MSSYDRLMRRGYKIIQIIDQLIVETKLYENRSCLYVFKAYVCVYIGVYIKSMYYGSCVYILFIILMTFKYIKKQHNCPFYIEYYIQVLM